MEQCVVCYSGGHSSALVGIEAVRRYGKNNVILLNHDISSEVEHKDIKRFKDDISNYLDIPITYANMEKWEIMTPLRVCEKAGAFTNPVNQQALCTYNLKTEPFYKWLKTFFPTDMENPNKDIEILYGFDSQEKARIQRRSSVLGAKGYYTDYPLALWDRTIGSTIEIGIVLPITYKIFKHANCIGCLKGGMKHWYVVYCLYPNIFAEAAEVEKELNYSIIKDHFLEELIPLYKETQAKGICPNDKENGRTFWNRVNKIMPDQLSFLPCDCAVL